MGSSLGPGAWQVNFEIDRWLDLESRLGLDTFHAAQAIPLPNYQPPTRNTETGYGVALDFMHLPLEIQPLADSLGEMKARAGMEYVTDVNSTNDNTFRALLQLNSRSTRHGAASSGTGRNFCLRQIDGCFRRQRAWRRRASH